MKKKILFAGIISVTIAILVSISSVLDIVSLKNNYLETVANNNAIVSMGVVNKLEYSLKYGKSLENFYGIDDLFQQANAVCTYADNAYIIDATGSILYEKNNQNSTIVRSHSFQEHTRALLDSRETYATWTEGEYQHILISVRDRSGERVACFGLNYNTGTLNAELDPLVRQLVASTVVPIILGVLLFVFLFFVIKHQFNSKKLLLLIIPIILCTSAVCGGLSYSVYREGYTDLTRQTADMFFSKIKSDIDSVTDQGIRYDELTGMEDYFGGMIAGTSQIKKIELVHAIFDDASVYYPLDSGENYIKIQTSQNFVQGKLSDIIVEIIVSIVTSALISAEVVVFIVATFTNSDAMRKRRRNALCKTEDTDALPPGVVRGLFFFFAMFQYLSMAFVPIVMAQIYRPVLGLPYEIVLCIPITAQIFVSIFSAWMCGKIISNRGWRPVALFGMTVMIVGALMASVSTEPLFFILAQVVLGLGLGCAKTAFDIFSVIVPARKNIEDYTAGANAGLIVGMSCSAAIGGVIASVFGFSGAFLAMAGFGVFVIVLILIFASNLKAPVPKRSQAKASRGKLDGRFAGYLILLIVPYFFVSMYLDYFFPVYADSHGMSTAHIGHIFLLYGIATSYVGAYLCKLLTKRFRNVLLMSCLLLLLGAFMGVFAVGGTLALAIAFVLLIAVVDGIMPSLQYRFVFSLDIAKSLGISRALGIEGALSSAIRCVAPLIFGLAMLYGSRGILVSGAVVVIAAVLFGVLNRGRGVDADA